MTVSGILSTSTFWTLNETVCWPAVRPVRYPERGIGLINAEEEALIRQLIADRTFPQKWDGDEPSAAAWLDSVYSDGSVQPILFRDMVGS